MRSTDVLTIPFRRLLLSDMNGHTWRNIFGVNTRTNKSVQILCTCGESVEARTILETMARYEQHVEMKSLVASAPRDGVEEG